MGSIWTKASLYRPDSLDYQPHRSFSGNEVRSGVGFFEAFQTLAVIGGGVQDSIVGFRLAWYLGREIRDDDEMITPADGLYWRFELLGKRDVFVRVADGVVEGSDGQVKEFG